MFYFCQGEFVRSLSLTEIFHFESLQWLCVRDNLELFEIKLHQTKLNGWTNMLLYGNGDESNFSFEMGRFIMADAKKLITGY